MTRVTSQKGTVAARSEIVRKKTAYPAIDKRDWLFKYDRLSWAAKTRTFMSVFMHVYRYAYMCVWCLSV